MASTIKGDPLVAPQELLNTGASTSGTSIGAKFTAGDGRVYRYALGSATALVQGNVYQSQIQDATNLQNLSVLAAGTGTAAVTTSSTVTLSANQLAGGYLSVGTGSGIGFLYQINGHAAASAGTVTFNLADPLQIGLTTTSRIDVIQNPYSGVIIGATTKTGYPVGVAVSNTSATWYGYLQTHGPASVISDGAIPIRAAVTPSEAVAGAVMAQTTGTQPCIGWAMMTTTDKKSGTFFLTID